MVLSEKKVLSTGNNPSYLFNVAGMDKFVDSLIKEFKTHAPVMKENTVKFNEIKSAKDIAWDYGNTMIPPKKQLQPLVEKIFVFDSETAEADDSAADVKEKQVIFGLRACDINAIHVLDKVFSEEDYEDPYYTERRNNSILVGLVCNDVHDTCFCKSFGAGPNIEEGFDLLITQLGDRFLVEVGSKVGQELLDKHGKEGMEDELLVKEYIHLKEARIENLVYKMQNVIDISDLDHVLEEGTEHKVWEKNKEKCLACGSCTIVCPTCFCFSVADRVDLSLKKGERERAWKSCMLLDYSEVALGENTREDLEERLKHRIYHKLYNQGLQFNVPGCVGCGRCIEYCIVNIDLRDIVRELRGDKGV